MSSLPGYYIGDPTSVGTTSGARIAVRYPDPFFDLSQAYFPKNERQLHKWCFYYAKTHGTFYSFVTKMTSYGLTRIAWGSSHEEDTRAPVDPRVREWWRNTVEVKLRLLPTAFRAGLQYWTCGNYYVSINYPFDRWLVCPNCGHRRQAKSFGKNEYRWRAYGFEGVCRSCKRDVRFQRRDVWVQSVNRMSIKLWNPLQILPVVNEATDDVDFYYEPSENFIARIRRGDRQVIETAPWAFIQAARKGTSLIKMSKDNFLAVQAPSLSGAYNGYGHAPTLAALKDAFGMQLTKRANEMVTIERSVPMSILHPLPVSGDLGGNPAYMINLKDHMAHIQEQLARARRDPTYQAYSPVPIGATYLWGDGKALMLSAEIRAQLEILISDLAVPQEFLLGGTTWTSGSVALRMLENQVLTHMEGNRRLSAFVIRGVSRFLNVPPVPHHWTLPKMADDIQRKQLMLSMRQMGEIGSQTLASEFDLDSQAERRDIEDSTLFQSRIQAIQMKEQARAQMEVQKMTAEMQPPMMPGMMPGTDPGMGGGQAAPEEAMAPAFGNQEGTAQAVERLAMAVANAGDESQAQAMIEQIAAQSPELAQAVVQRLQTMFQQQQQPQQLPAPQQPMQMMQQPQYGPVDMRPLPEQRAPRREAGNAMI